MALDFLNMFHYNMKDYRDDYRILILIAHKLVPNSIDVKNDREKSRLAQKVLAESRASRLKELSETD